MMKYVFLLLTVPLILLARPVHDMTVGNWQTLTQSVSENKTHVVEKESLQLKADHSFEIIILVNLKKGEHFIKDLQVKATGIWKRYHTTLVVVINKIEVPFAKEVSRTITRRSLKSLAGIYQARLKETPIRIYTITYLDDKKLTVVNEKSVSTTYTKYIAPPPKQKTPKTP